MSASAPASCRRNDLVAGDGDGLGERVGWLQGVDHPMDENEIGMITDFGSRRIVTGADLISGAATVAVGKSSYPST